MVGDSGLKPLTFSRKVIASLEADESLDSSIPEASIHIAATRGVDAFKPDRKSPVLSGEDRSTEADKSRDHGQWLENYWMKPNRKSGRLRRFTSGPSILPAAGTRKMASGFQMSSSVPSGSTSGARLPSPWKSGWEKRDSQVDRDRNRVLPAALTPVLHIRGKVRQIDKVRVPELVNLPEPEIS